MVSLLLRAVRRTGLLSAAKKKKKKSFPCKVGPGRASGERCCPGWHGRQPQCPVLGTAATRPNKSRSPPRDSGEKAALGSPQFGAARRRHCTGSSTPRLPGAGLLSQHRVPTRAVCGAAPPSAGGPAGLGASVAFHVCPGLPLSAWLERGGSQSFICFPFLCVLDTALCPSEGIPFPQATLAFSGISASPGEKGRSWPGAAAACVPAQGLLCGLGRLLGRCWVSCHHLRCQLPDANSRIWPLVYPQKEFRRYLRPGARVSTGCCEWQRDGAASTRGPSGDVMTPGLARSSQNAYGRHKHGH